MATKGFFESPVYGGNVNIGFNVEELGALIDESSDQDVGTASIRVMDAPSRVAALTLLKLAGKKLIKNNQQAVTLEHLTLPREDLTVITRSDYFNNPNTYNTQVEWDALRRAIDENPACHLTGEAAEITGDFAFGLAMVDRLGRSALVGSTRIKHMLDKRLEPAPKIDIWW